MVSEARFGRSSPKNIIITGATGGIGSALARVYAGADTTLGLTGRDAVRLRDVADDCRTRGATVVAETLDVTNAAALEAFISDFDSRYPLELVIANAGVNSGSTPEAVMENAADIEEMIAVNLHGCINTVLPAVEAMKSRGRGQIAVMGSLAALRGLPNCPAYSASKAAVETFAQGLRGAVAGYGIHISVISPGYVKSPMTDRLVGPKPLIMDADKAASIIQRGLHRGRAHISFPLILALGMRLLVLLPASIADRIVAQFSFTVGPKRDAADGPKGEVR